MLNTAHTPKTIPEVLGLKPDMATKIVNEPDDYSQIMADWSFGHQATATKKIDFAHLFVKKKTDLLAKLPELKEQLKPNGMIWVSWLKKSSGTPTDVTESDIRNFAINIGLVDIKVCAVSDIWSGLKLVIPLAQRYN